MEHKVEITSKNDDLIIIQTELPVVTKSIYTIIYFNGTRGKIKVSHKSPLRGFFADVFFPIVEVILLFAHKVGELYFDSFVFEEIETESPEYDREH